MLFCKVRRVAVLGDVLFSHREPVGLHCPRGDPRLHVGTSDLRGPAADQLAVVHRDLLPAFMPVRVFHIEHPLSYFLLWLGVSIGMHAFPSTHDAGNLFQHAKKAAKTLNPLAILSFPLVILIVLANSRWSSGQLLVRDRARVGTARLVLRSF